MPAMRNTVRRIQAVPVMQIKKNQIQVEEFLWLIASNPKSRWKLLSSNSNYLLSKMEVEWIEFCMLLCKQPCKHSFKGLRTCEKAIHDYSKENKLLTEKAYKEWIKCL